MRLGILGSGLMGGTLGTLFARAGHEVVFSYSRSNDKLNRLALQAGGGARAGTPREAAHGADAVLLAVHWSHVHDVLEQAGDLAGKVVVTCSLPMNDSDTTLVVGHTSSGAEELAKELAKRHPDNAGAGPPVVCAFNTVPSEVLLGVYEARGRALRPSLVYCGDDAPAKNVAAALIRDVGFDPVDVGPLRIARYTEPFALVVGELAYGGNGGPQVAYRFVRLPEQA
jgi:8-hydroxy-5-deazaflavin:NADPH oxidoreductase